MRKYHVAPILAILVLASALGCGGNAPSGPPSTWKAPQVHGELNKSRGGMSRQSIQLPPMPGQQK